ncbi:hypothetical protein GIB67_030679 [Kingdonia uniflora]|uniref:Auxin-responsive protein n=1 Tax=Kingdonia uniflora TaxID=39325 RepID=A0A7J7NIJ0_9MAGN|nr:hypothetical protein GIB67_030679 [Kingdonia uniflora]
MLLPSEIDTGSALNFNETELTLGLPGESRAHSAKRGFSETVSHSDTTTEISSSAKTPVANAQVVGWPPVRSFRKNVLKSCTYVKVAVDGAPYLRKVDLEMYTSYTELLNALEEMFTCFTVNGTDYVSTFEDKDGDWMLVGDVPWKMFVTSCKRLWLMKKSEETGQSTTPRTPSKSTSTCTR